MVGLSLAGVVLAFGLAYVLASRGAISLERAVIVALVSIPLAFATVLALAMALAPEAPRSPLEQFLFVLLTLTPVSLAAALAVWLGQRRHVHQA